MEGVYLYMGTCIFPHQINHEDRPQMGQKLPCLFSPVYAVGIHLGTVLCLQTKAFDKSIT